MKTKRAPLVTLPPNANLTKAKAPPGMTKKVVSAYYLRSIVFGVANLVEMYRGGICVLVYDRQQRGVVYFNSSFKPQILHLALKKALTLLDATSGEYTFRCRVIYFTETTTCASKNPAYHPEYNRLDVVNHKALQKQLMAEMLKENTEFYRKAGLWGESESTSTASAYRRQYLANKKAGLSTPWSEERKQRKKSKQSQKV